MPKSNGSRGYQALTEETFVDHHRRSCSGSKGQCASHGLKAAEPGTGRALGAALEAHRGQYAYASSCSSVLTVFRAGLHVSRLLESVGCRGASKSSCFV